MPTASEFRAAASRLRGAADDAGWVAQRMWSVGNDHGVSGGRLETVVETALVANALTAGDLQRQCEELAELCAERAEVCDRYAADLDQHAADLARWQTRYDAWRHHDPDVMCVLPPGPRPQRPQPPASWVEVG